MHESFNNEIKTCFPGHIDKKSLSKDHGKDECAMTLNGWGFFELKFVIHFKKEETGKESCFTYEHWLCFDGNGRHETINLPFNKQKIEELKK